MLIARPYGDVRDVDDHAQRLHRSHDLLAERRQAADDAAHDPVRRVELGRDLEPLALTSDHGQDRTGRHEHQDRVLADNGLLGIQTPEEYGGHGGSIFEVVLALEQISQICVNTAMLPGGVAGDLVIGCIKKAPAVAVRAGSWR